MKSRRIWALDAPVLSSKTGIDRARNREFFNEKQGAGVWQTRNSRSTTESGRGWQGLARSRPSKRLFSDRPEGGLRRPIGRIGRFALLSAVMVHRPAARILARSTTAIGTGRTPKTSSEKSEVRIFVSYSHVDAGVRGKLETHLAALKRENVVTWYDGDLDAGDALDTSIARELRRSHLFIALLSPEYIASHYCWRLEYQRAMNRRARGALRVVAVVVRPCDWKATRAAHFKLLPTDGRPVSRWRSADEALLDVAQGVRRVVTSIRRDMPSPKKTTGNKASTKTGMTSDKRRGGKTGRTVKGSAPATKGRRTAGPGRRPK